MTRAATASCAVPRLAPLARLGRFRDGAVSSHSSFAPSSRAQAAGRPGRGVPLLRSRSASSEKRGPRDAPSAAGSLSCRATSQAPRLATLPHFLAWVGRGRSGSLDLPYAPVPAAASLPVGLPVVLRSGRAPAPLLLRSRSRSVRGSLGRPVDGEPEREAPVRGAPVRGRPPCPELGRDAPPLESPRRCAPSPDRAGGRPWPPPERPPPDPAALPRPAPPVPVEREADRPEPEPVPPPLPDDLELPEPPERVGRAGRAAPPGRAGRADWARRFGCGERGGIGRFYVANPAGLCRPARDHLGVGAPRSRRSSSPTTNATVITRIRSVAAPTPRLPARPRPTTMRTRRRSRWPCAPGALAGPAPDATRPP